MSALSLRYAVRSDQGLVRGNNEDSVYAGPRLLAIADGMGGHAGGEVASKMVIGDVEYLDDDRPIEDLITTLRDAVRTANETLASAVLGHPELEGMGTTLTALRFAGAKVGLVHVGDSRAYMLRNGALSQITHDDTYVQSLVDAGRLTAEEANHHPRKSVILRALNGTDVEPDVSIREARRGDRYLLCSDGLSDVVRADTILEAMASGDPQDCADRLVGLALRGGGPDNVTVIVADVVEGVDGDDVPVVAGAVVDPGVDFDSGDDDESPARRAALLSRVHRPTRTAARGSRSRWRTWAIPVLIVVVLLGGSIGTYFWTQTQYFVGRKGSAVAVFRGVNTSFGPIHMFRVVERSAVVYVDLNQAARDQVASGITADNRQEADAIIDRLRGRLLPLCEVSQPSPSPSSSPGSSTSSSPSRRTTPSTRKKPSASKSPSASASPTPSLTVTPQQPGVDCRPQR